MLAESSRYIPQVLDTETDMLFQIHSLDNIAQYVLIKLVYSLQMRLSDKLEVDMASAAKEGMRIIEKLIPILQQDPPSECAQYSTDPLGVTQTTSQNEDDVLRLLR